VVLRAVAKPPEHTAACAACPAQVNGARRSKGSNVSSRMISTSNIRTRALGGLQCQHERLDVLDNDIAAPLDRQQLLALAGTIGVSRTLVVLVGEAAI